MRRTILLLSKKGMKMSRASTVPLMAVVLLTLSAWVALVSKQPDGTLTAQTRIASSPPSCTITGTATNDTSDIKPSFPGSPDKDDVICGHAGDDKIDALDAPATTPSPAMMGDTALGGPGNDAIAANDGSKDHIVCGTGSRDIAYSDKRPIDTVSSDCEWRASYSTPEYCSESGTGGPPWTNRQKPESEDWPEFSYVGEKILWCIDGTGRDNKNLVGTTHSDVIDSIWGGNGDDKLNGRLGVDALEGWSGNDILVGETGNDWLFGDDTKNPNEGPTPEYFKTAGEDKIYGGPGDDFIGAIDNKTDTISCGGGGLDEVHYDQGLDRVAKDCEIKKTVSEPALYYGRRFGHHKKGGGRGKALVVDLDQQASATRYLDPGARK